MKFYRKFILGSFSIVTGLSALLFITALPGHAAAKNTASDLAKNFLIYDSDNNYWHVKSGEVTQTALETRLQTYLMEFHQALERENLLPDGIPGPPYIKITGFTGERKSLGLNGRSKGTVVCIKSPKQIIISDSVNTGGREAYLQFVGDSIYARGAQECTTAKNEVLTLTEMRSAIRSVQKITGCEFTEGSDAFRLDKNTCNVSGQISAGRFGNGVGLIISRTTPEIQLNQDSISIFSSEASLIAILAHEAAHYYLAHSSRMAVSQSNLYIPSLKAPYQKYSGLDPVAYISPHWSFDKIQHALRVVSEGYDIWKESVTESEFKLYQEIDARVRDTGLAAYTQESEADDLGALILALAGYPPTAMSDFVLETISLQERDSCAIAAPDAKWPFYGIFRNAHGSSCFRAYSAKKNAEYLKSIGYVPLKTFMTIDKWKKFQAEYSDKNSSR